MTATPPPAPPDPAGPPTSGTLDSSTPTPQQLAGTKSEEGLSYAYVFVVPEKFIGVLKRKSTLGFR